MQSRNFAWIVAFFLVAIPSKNVFADTDWNSNSSWNSSSSFGNTQEKNAQSAVMTTSSDTSTSDADKTSEHADSISTSQSAVMTAQWDTSTSDADETSEHADFISTSQSAVMTTSYDTSTSDADKTLYTHGDSQAESISSLNGFEIRFGTSVPLGLANAIAFGAFSENLVTLDARDYLNVTVAASIELGYRGKYAGVYLQQYIGGSIYKGDEFDTLADFSNDYKAFLYGSKLSVPLYKKNATSFTGASYLTLKGFLDYNDIHYFIITLGFGIKYGMHADIPFFTSLDELDEFNYGFSIKTGLGYEYRMSSHATIGLYIEYAPYMVGGYLLKHDSSKERLSTFIHVIQPSVNIGYTF